MKKLISSKYLLFKPGCSWTMSLEQGVMSITSLPLVQHTLNTPSAAFFWGGEDFLIIFILFSLSQKSVKNWILKDFFTQVILTKGTFGSEGMFFKCLYLSRSQIRMMGPLNLGMQEEYLRTLGYHRKCFFSAKIFSAFNNPLSFLCLYIRLLTSQEHDRILNYYIREKENPPFPWRLAWTKEMPLQVLLRSL